MTQINYFHIVRTVKCNDCGYEGDDLTYQYKFVTTQDYVHSNGSTGISQTSTIHCPRCDSQNHNYSDYGDRLPMTVFTPVPSDSNLFVQLKNIAEAQPVYAGDLINKDAAHELLKREWALTYEGSYCITELGKEKLENYIQTNKF